MRLGEAMVKDGLINNDQLAKALERQIIFGGRLGTNLVESGSISEETLAKFLSKVLKVPYADHDSFKSIPVEVIKAFPRELAEKYTACPILLEGKRLHLAMKDPNDMGVVDELRFILGLHVNPYIASEMRIYFALEKYYGVKRDLRYVSILDEERQMKAEPQANRGWGDARRETAAGRAEDATEAAAAVSPGAGVRAAGVASHKGGVPADEYLAEEEVATARATASEVMENFAAREKGVAAEEAAEARLAEAESGADRAREAAEAKAPAELPAAGERDPYERLASPVDREDVAGALVAAAVGSGGLSRAVMFMVKDRILTGWLAAGENWGDGAVTSLRLTLDEPTVFKDVVEDKASYKGPVIEVPQNVRLIQALGGARPLDAVVFPLIIRDKIVGVLYGDNGHGNLVACDMGGLSSLMAKASMSLEILILKHKILGG